MTLSNLNRRHALSLMGGTAIAGLTGLPAFSQTEDWAALGADVKAEFKWAWDHYVDKAWPNEEWSRGCYGGFMPTGAWTDHGSALRAPIGPIHWAGAETGIVWNGYMDGAVTSGERAAAEITEALA